MRIPHVYHPEPVLHAANTDAAFLTQANIVSTGLEDPVFTTAVQLKTLNVTLKVSIVAFSAARTLASSPSKPTNAVNDRNTARKTMNTCLRDVGHELTKVMATYPPDLANSYILIAGYTPRKQHVFHQADFEISDGPKSGSVKVRIKARADGKHGSTHVQGSADGGKSWTLDDSGTHLIYLFEGLTVGVAYLFRYRIKTGKVWSDWTLSAPHVVR